jgi:DNA-binding response OmpR family regulator
MEETTKKICIIEDMSAINRLYITILKKSGYECVNFFDGKSAKEWLKTNTPSCIVLDILLPDMSGTDLLKFIRDLPNGENIPIIAVTGFAHGKDKQQFLDLGFDHYISKPINTNTFVDEVISVIEGKK